MLSTLEDAAVIGECKKRFYGATNMTDQISALSYLVEIACPEREAALADFFKQWKEDPLVILKWIGLQVSAFTKNASNASSAFMAPIFFGSQKSPWL